MAAKKEKVNWSEVARVKDDGEPIKVQVDPAKAQKAVEEKAAGFVGATPLAPVTLSPISDAQTQEILSEISVALEETAPASKGPTPDEIAHAQAVLAAAKALDPDPPVSLSKEPIKLLEPERSKYTSVDFGDMQIVASPDRIDFMRSEGILPREVPTREEVQERRMEPVRISNKVMAEQEAGRRTLAQHQMRAVTHPPAQRSQKEIDAEGRSTTVIDPEFHPLQNLLRKHAGQQMGGDLAQGGGAHSASGGNAPVIHSPKGGGY